MNQFVDEVKIKIRSGDGGNGMVAWRREKYEPLGGPAGGTGGRGGDVVLEASNDLSTLLDFRFKNEYEAPCGAKGGPKNKHGKAGTSLTLKVPVGTVVRDLETDRIIADLNKNGQKVLVAEGGRGGRGNAALATQQNRAPYYCEPGEQGIERELELTLKLLADLGLVGLPNAGKSTLLSVLTSARPKIANYPFSTLSPNLGVMQRPEGDAYVLADIPGLISGASEGIGLGHTFLRHIERTRILVHVIDISSSSIEQDISTICHELDLYDKKLALMPQIVFLNKIDLLDKENIDSITTSIKLKKDQLFGKDAKIHQIIQGSCASNLGIDTLRNAILELLANTPKPELIYQVLDDERAYQHPDTGFTVNKKRNIFYVSGERIERLLEVTNIKNPDSLQHFFHVARAMGIIDAMLEEGLEQGQEIVIGKTSFIYGNEIY